MLKNRLKDQNPENPCLKEIDKVLKAKNESEILQVLEYDWANCDDGRSPQAPDIEKLWQAFIKKYDIKIKEKDCETG